MRRQGRGPGVPGSQGLRRLQHPPDGAAAQAGHPDRRHQPGRQDPDPLRPGHHRTGRYRYRGDQHHRPQRAGRHPAARGLSHEQTNDALHLRRHAGAGSRLYADAGGDRPDLRRVGRLGLYDNLISEMADGQRCTYCNKQSATQTYDPVFVNLGYSTANINGICSVIQGFKVNRASLSTYNEKLENDITEFGVLAASAVKISDTAFDVNGKAKDGVVSATIKEVNDHFDIKITNILENETIDGETAYTDAMFHLCAYVKAGDTIYYISAGYVGTSLGQAISYNTVK